MNREDYVLFKHDLPICFYKSYLDVSVSLNKVKDLTSEVFGEFVNETKFGGATKGSAGKK